MATILTPGDIAFSAFQADNSGGGFNGDAFEFVLLVPVTVGTTIYFTDNGYRTDSSTFRTNENLVRWVAQTDLPAGTIKTFTAPGGTGAASTAEWTGINTTTGANLATAALGLAAGGDSITALINPTFGGTDALNGTAIASITFGGATFAATFTAASGNATTALAPGLTDGVNAISLASTDNGRYNDAAAGSVESGTQAVVRASLNNDAYWTTSTTPLSPHNTTATFVVSGVVIPTVTIAATDNTAAEAGQEPGTFRISRTGATTEALTVNYTIATGTGQATSDDYTPTLTGTVEIPVGASFVDVTITPVDDAAVEGAETVTLNLTDTATYDLGTETSATVTIADNDAAPSEPIDLSTYVRIGRYNLPEPTRTTAPAGSGLAQEVSAVTYNPNTDTLFVIGDEGTSIVQVTKTGQLIDSMTLTAGDFNDPEGLTYVGGNQFVLIEERERQASLFTYVPDGTLSRANVQSVKLGTTVGNIGLEGISYDPQTGGYVLVKETSPQGIFQTGIDFGAGTATNGSPATVNSTNLFDPALLGLTDIADVYALSNLPGALTDDNLLVLSQEDGRIVNVDRAGNITSSLQIASDSGNPLTVAGQGFEGVTMDNNGLLYITSEQGGGDSDHPQLWVYAPASYVYSNAAPVAVSLSNAVTNLAENSDTTNPIKVGNIIISDDALGTNTLSLTGTDAAAFEIVGTELFLKAGTALDFETKPSFAVTINVDDPALGSSPDASTTFTLNIADTTDTPAALIISEVAPWSSGNSPGVGADWFEVTNTSGAAIDITGWRIDDDSASFANSSALSGVTSIAPGQSVVFVDGTAATVNAFVNTWFGGTLPSGVAIGTYGGPGLGTGGDAVNLFDASGALVTGVTFGASPAASPFASFDNATGLPSVSNLSTIGVNGAFSVIDVGANAAAVLIGSPGTTSVAPVPLTTQVAIAATDAAAAEAGQNPGTFTIFRTGDTTNPLTVVYGFAVGAGQATSDDYSPNLTGNVEIPAGASSVDITIAPVDDPFPEGTETVTLVLLDQPGYDVAANASSATVTIADNDNSGPPQLVPGDVIFNEYASDNDANGNDFFELLVLKDGADLRGLRVSDNELVSGMLNNNESVFVFGNDSFLSNVAKGTTIAVYTIATGVTTDTVTSSIAGDWSMTLAPGTGVTVSVDGLGGSINTGLSTGGEALYLYLPGADGTSAGTDNQYLDFVSFESDGGDAPAGLADLNLASVADNAYYTGNTAAGNDTAANWVRYDFPSTNPTPGDANPGQDLSGLRSVPFILNETFDYAENGQARAFTITDANGNPINFFGEATSFDYFGVRDGAGDGGADFGAGPVPTNFNAYTGFDDNHLIASDIDGGDTNAIADPAFLTWSGLNISGLSNLLFSVDVATLNTDNGLDPDDFLKFEYRVDGGAWQNLLAFETADATTSNQTTFLEDTDFNGIGDGTALTAAAQTFTKLFSASGNTLDLRAAIRVEAGFEDIGFDTVKLQAATGSLVSIAATDAAKAEGNSGSTVFTFTVTRSGNTSGTATVQYAVTSSAADGADFVGGVLPSGLVEFANNETSKVIEVLISGDTTVEPNETFTVNLSNPTNATIATGTANGTIISDDVLVTKIHQIQGNATTQLPNISGSGVHNDRSPLEGQSVTIQGIVTAVYPQLNGFFIQEETTDVDGDSTTSEGIFVFTGSAPTVSEGNLVTVTGAVDEFFGMTQIDNDNGNLSVTINNNGNNLNLISPAILDLPAVGDLNDYYEQFEGMKVQFSDKLVVSEYFELARYGQLVLTEGDRPFQYSHIDNTPTAAEYTTFLDSLNRSRIILDDGNNIQNFPIDEDANSIVDSPNDGKFPYPQPGGLSTGTQGINYFRGGDSITGLTGVLHWSFAGQSGTDAWRIRPTQTDPINFAVENSRPTEAPNVGGNVKVASFNVLNYFDGPFPTSRGADSAAEFDRQNEKLIAALQGINADIFGLVEIENNGTAVQELVNRLNAVVGAGTYNYINTGVVGTDEITVALIYKPSVVQPKGTAAILDDPAFTDPNGTGQQRSRPAVAQTFEVINPNNPDFGAAFNVVVNHLKSKGASGASGADLDQNDGQGAWNDTRTKAAAYLANVWIPSDPTGQGDADWLVIGDLNAYKGETPITALKTAGYTDLVEQFGGPNAYSYVFNGQLGYLDYALANGSLASQVTGVAEWHINADEVPAFDYNDSILDAGESFFEAEPGGNPLYEANAFRTSDHDPVIIGLNLTVPNQAPTAVNLSNVITTLAENTSTVTRIKVADIAVTDDGQGNNILSLSGTDASFFEIDGNALYLKAGTSLDFETDSSYAVTVNVDDAAVGANPDASVNYTLAVTNVAESATISGIATAIVTEDLNVTSGNLSASGSLTVNDPDAGESLFSTTVTPVGSVLGNLSITAAGVFTYQVANSAVQTLGAGATQIETFTVQSVDGSATQDITVTINGVNDAPVLTGIAATLPAGSEDTTYEITVADLLAGFTDVDSSSLSVSNVQVNGVALTTNVAGNYLFNPPTNANGNFTVAYDVTDGLASTAASLGFTLAAVNDAPIALNDSATTTDTQPVTINVLANDSDVDSALSPSSVAIAANPGNGTVAVTAAGAIVYTPNVGFGGTDTFTYTVKDVQGLTSNPATVSVGVTRTTNLIQGTSAADTLFGSFGDDLIQGLGGNDFILALSGNDTVFGGAGNDTIDGGFGDDTIDGGTGNDSLFGGFGNDILVGGSGNDLLFGGAGNDKFVYNALSDRNDTVVDFNRFQDQVVLTGLFQSLGYAGSNPISDGFLRFRQSGGSALVQIDQNGTIGGANFSTLVTLNGTNAANLVIGSNVIV